MKLPAEAMNQFLARPRRRLDKYKSLPLADLERLASKLPVPIPLWPRLRLHQKVMAVVGARLKRVCLFADTGCGKSVTSLVLIQHFVDQGLVKHALILTPNRAVKFEWVRELRKHMPTMRFCILTGSSTNKWQMLEQTDATVIVESYPGLVRMCCTLERGRRGKNKLKPDRRRVLDLAARFQGLICDESTSVKNHQALPYRICRQLAKRAEIVFCLSGTPHGRNPADLWSQVHLVDGGVTLGESLGLFRAAFFRERMNWFGGLEYTFRKNSMGLLNRFLSHASIRYEADQADLPRVTRIIKSVSLPKDTNIYYQRALEEIRKSRGNASACKNAFLRMRQISSGFLSFTDDGEKAQFEFPTNPKREMLLALVESLAGHKAIVFYEFTHSAERIITELKKLDIQALHLWGGTKKPEDVLQQFNRQDADVLLLQNSFGFGLNLQVAKYAVFFESPTSPIIRKQCRRRVERQGSAHQRVFVYDLIVRNTVDSAILAWLKQGDDLLRGIIDGRAKL